MCPIPDLVGLLAHPPIYEVLGRVNIEEEACKSYGEQKCWYWCEREMYDDKRKKREGKDIKVFSFNR